MPAYQASTHRSTPTLLRYQAFSPSSVSLIAMTPLKLSRCFAILIVLTNVGPVEPFQSPAARRGSSTIAHHRRLSSLSSRCYHASPSTFAGHAKRSKSSSSSALRPFHHYLSSSKNDDNNYQQIDSLIYQTSTTLRATSWFSWWSQVILTVISTVTFLFARNVMDAQAAATPMELSRVASKFFLPGVGVVVSTMSIIWTWGQRRLANRFIRRTGTSRVEAANLLRRVIKVGVTLNLIGLLTSVLGAQYIVGTLVAKSMQSFGGFGGFGGGGVIASQTLQPLDVLVVQANTNVLSSHFVSLACLLWLTRMVDRLDPPSLDEDDV
ncbi:hypothetical protein ACHAXR_013045 [Thalassiosira sp. AJA248-18]